MANYTLNIKTFIELDEVVSTIGYLNENFSGLLGINLSDYLARNNKIAEYELQRSKMALILAFNSFFTKKENTNNSFSVVYNSNKDDGTAQRILCSKFLLEKEYLEENNIDIDFCLKNELLVSINPIYLKQDELDFIVQTLKSIRLVSEVSKVNLIDNILKSLKQ